VRSANRAARAAERSLLAGLRPVLVPSRDDDPVERIMFGDSVWLTVPGHAAVIQPGNEAVHMAMGIRNAGAGLAVLHGWHVRVWEEGTTHDRPEIDDFRRQSRDLYIPAGDSGFWQGAIRDTSDESYRSIVAALRDDDRIVVDLLYGDYEGGQRTIARFSVVADGDRDDGARNASAVRYWNVDGADPR
jgi:hypothetical protein